MPTLIEMVRASVWRQPMPQAQEGQDQPPSTSTETPATHQGGDKLEKPSDTGPREALKAAGVKFHHKTNDDKLADMLAAFKRSGLSGESWNLLSDADRAQYYEAQ